MKLLQKDFIIDGQNPVTEAMPDGNIIELFQKLQYRYGFVSFVKGDDFHTARGITFPSDKAAIVKQYGKAQEEHVVESDPVYQCGIAQHNMEVVILHQAGNVLIYTMNDYQIRFYLNRQDGLLLIAFCLFPNA